MNPSAYVAGKCAIPKSWRSRLLVAVIALASLTSTATAVVGAAEIEAPRGGASASTPWFDGELGVNVDLLSLTPNQRMKALDWLTASGIRLVRQPVDWQWLEPVQGEQRWAELDDLDRAFNLRGIAWVASVSRSPDWARRDPPPPEHWMVCDARFEPGSEADAPPTEPRDLAVTVAALAVRYADSLAAIEVWREPNLLPNWRAGGPDPEDYAVLLTAVTEAVRTTAPGVRILSGALAPTTEVGVCYLSDVVFLDRLARTGVLHAVDGVAIQPFGLREPPGSRQGDRERLDHARADRLHKVLVAHEVTVPLWAVAWGWAIGEPEGAYGGFPPETAARFLRDGWAIARSDWPWMGPMIVWHLGPPSALAPEQRGFALLDESMAPTALGAAVAALAGSPDSDVAAPPPESQWPSPLISALLAAGLALFMTAYFARGLWWPALTSSVECMVSPLSHCSTSTVAMAYGVAVAVALLAPWPFATLTWPVLLVLALARPLVAVSAVVAVAPFWYGLRLQLGPRAVAPIEGLLLLAVIARMVRLGTQSAQAATAPEFERPEPHSSRLHLPTWFGSWTVLDGTVAILVLWSMATPLWAAEPELALREVRTVFIEPALFYLLLRAGSSEWRRNAVSASFNAVVVGAAIAAVWALGDLTVYATGHGGRAVAVEGVVRAVGPYASPNNLALVLGRALAAIGAAIAVLGVTGRRRWYVAACMVIAPAFVATFSRGAFLFGIPAAAVAVASVAVMARVGPGQGKLVILRRSALSFGLIVILGAVILAPFVGTQRLRGTLDFAPGSTGFIRVQLWRSAWQMGLDHPVFGVGPDNFLSHYRDRYVHRSVVQERHLNHPHNLVLDWWTRLGLPGLILLVVQLTAVGRVLPRAWRNVRSAERWTVAAAASMAAYALGHGLVDNHIFLPDLALLWWLVVAALVAGATNRQSMGPPGFEPETYRL